MPGEAELGHAVVADAFGVPFYALVQAPDPQAPTAADVVVEERDGAEVLSGSVVVAGEVVVCPDVSGSMQSPVTGYRKGATTSVRCIDVAALVASDPDRFFIPPYVGGKGWLALHLDAPAIDWAEVAELVEDSYRHMAPKRALKLLDATRSR